MAQLGRIHSPQGQAFTRYPKAASPPVKALGVLGGGNRIGFALTQKNTTDLTVILENRGRITDIQVDGPGILWGRFLSEAIMAEFNTIGSVSGTRAAQIDAGLRAHMNKVYGTMSVGLLLTFLAAWAVGTNEMLMQTLFTGMTRYVVMFAPLVMVFAMGAMIPKLSVAGAQLFFYAFATLMGVSISYIFMIYTDFSIAQTFLVTSIAFAGLSLYGYTTKKDISGWGAFLIMGVIGILVAMVVNIFLQSEAIMFAISIIGVLIFAGLTAYDTQKIKNTYLQHAHGGDSEWLGKAAIMGALSLYLDFINMFMFLLHLMGNRD